MKKQKFFGIAVLVAVVVFGLMFTACKDDTDYIFTFSNISRYAITVTFQGDADPRIINLKAVPHDSLATERGTVTAKKGTTYGWSVDGKTDQWESTNPPKNRYVIAEPDGTGLLFSDNPDGLAKIGVIAVDVSE
jgi:hypothetical protein